MRMVLAIALAAALGLAALSASPAHAVWRGDFETGNFRQWQELQAANAPAYRGIVGNSQGVITRRVHRQGRYAARFTTLPGVGPEGFSLAQVYASAAETQGLPGRTAYYAWSVRIPSNPNRTQGWPRLGSWNVITEWHALEPCGPPITLGVDVVHRPARLAWEHDEMAGDCRLLRRHVRFFALRYDHWYDFVARIHWSIHHRFGSTRLWVDGCPLGPTQRGRTLPRRAGAYWKQGLYRGPFRRLNTVYIDSARRARSFSGATAGLPMRSPFRGGVPHCAKLAPPG